MRLGGIEYNVSVMKPDIILESEEHDLLFVRGYAEIERQEIDLLEAEMQRLHGRKWEGRTDYSVIPDLIDNERIEIYVREHEAEATKFYNI